MTSSSRKSQIAGSTNTFIPLQLITKNSFSIPSLFELVLEPQFLPFELNMALLLKHFGNAWNPDFDCMRVHSQSWYPGAMSNNELFIRHHDSLLGVVVMLTVKGMEVRIVSNSKQHCRQLFEGMDPLHLAIFSLSFC